MVCPTVHQFTPDARRVRKRGMVAHMQSLSPLSTESDGLGRYRQGQNLLVVWRITNACNLGCGFCGYSRSSALPRIEHVPDAVEAFARVLSDYRDESHESVRVSWIGGEPLLWKPIHRVSRYLAGELGLSLSVTTNGTALGAPKIVDTLRRHYDTVHISLDGVGDQHDDSRRLRGLYSKVLRRIARLTEAPGPQVGVNLLLTSDSIQCIDALCIALGNVGVSFLSINPLIVPDSSSEAARKLRVHDLDLLDQLVLRRPSIEQATGVSILGSAEYFARIRSYVRQVSTSISDCSPGQWRLLIDEVGLIHPCSFVCGGGAPVSVRTVTSADELRALADRFAGLIQRVRPRPCDDCMDPFVYGKFDHSS